VIGYTVLLEVDVPSRVRAHSNTDSGQFILKHRLCSALKRINPKITSDITNTVISQVTFQENSNLLENNLHFHKLLTQGIDVEYQVNDKIIQDKVWLIDADNLLLNDWLVIHPFVLVEDEDSYHLDVVVFINGLPLAVIVWIHPKDNTARLLEAYHRLQTYKQKIPTLFSYNAFLIIACGTRAEVGTLTSNWKEFLPWRTIDGEDFPLPGETELDILIQGLFDKRRFLELVKYFIFFENTEVGIDKKLLRYPFCTI